MTVTTIRGRSVEYELYGDPGTRTWVIHPGGRVSKDGAGHRDRRVGRRPAVADLRPPAPRPGRGRGPLVDQRRRVRADVPGQPVLRGEHPGRLERRHGGRGRPARATSDRLQAILPSARTVDPPWPDTEWIDRRARGETAFVRWPLLAPALHAWAEECVPAK